MFRYNLRAGFRNLTRLKSHVLISLAGLILGLACTFAISAWTLQELQFDRFHRQSRSIYMVTTLIMDNQEVANEFPETPPPLAASLRENIPEIENSCHFVYLYGGRSLRTGQNSFKEVGIAVDPRFLEILNFPVLRGDPNTLAEPNTIFLSEKLAEKIFPGQDPMGRRITYNKNSDVIVRGIIREAPENSSLQFDYLISYRIESPDPDNWWQLADATFIKTLPGADPGKIKQLARKVFRNGIPDEQYDLNIIPITRLRYGVKFSFFNAPHADSRQLYVFIGIAALILILSCLNYANLISAYAYKRGKEVGVRKAVGATTGSLRRLYLTESVLLSLAAWLFAIFLARLMSRYFQTIIHINIENHYLTLSSFAGIFLSVIVAGILAGLQPAILASSLDPFRQGAGSGYHSRARGRIKNAFVLFQFILSVSLTISSLVILKQTKFMRNFDVGYQKDSILEVGLPYKKSGDYRALKDELMADPGIGRVSISGRSPVNLQNLNLAENWDWEGLRQDKHIAVYRLNVDKDYLNVFRIPLAGGEFFTGSGSDSDKVVINQKLAGVMGFSDPIGQVMRQGRKEFRIIGIVRNFHFQHLSTEIQPLIMLYVGNRNKLFIKTDRNPQAVMEEGRSKFEDRTGQPLEYRFISDEYRDLYEGENNLVRAILALTFLTIFLSCIGLIGLVAFNTETRTKEIGIRKVHGAGAGRIMLLLNTGILKWLVAGSAIACVLSRIAMGKWLENYSSRISMDFRFYLFGIGIIALITILTVSWQTWKASVRNPASTLKYE